MKNRFPGRRISPRLAAVCLGAIALHAGCWARPKCKDTCYLKYLEGDDRSNCLSRCDQYYELENRKAEPEPAEKAHIPEMVLPKSKP